MRHNTNLTLLEIEQMREAVKRYAEEYFSPVRYVVIEGLESPENHYDYTAHCLIYFQADREFYHDGIREDDFVLGINRTGSGGFEISTD